MDWWVWIVAGVVFVLFELLGPTVVFLFFGVAAIAVGVLSGMLHGLTLTAQLALFSTLSVVSLVAFRGPLLRLLHGSGDDAEPIDSLIGERAVVRSAMQPGARGSVELRGTVFTAVNVGGSALHVGDACRVVEREGLTVHVRAERPAGGATAGA